MALRRWRLPATILGLAAAAAGAVVWASSGNGTMPRRAAEAALQRRLHSRFRFTCERVHNDGSIALPDVDYWCIRPQRRDLSGYWIGTDAHRITDTLPSG